MKPATLARLALAGRRADTLRVIFTAASSALAAVILLAAGAVAAIPEAGGADPVVHGYRPALIAEDGLRPGVIVTLLLLAVPVLALAGQCIRFGSPARDRRLAALRLSGATPGQAVMIAAGETAAAALLGSVSGLLLFLVGRWALDNPDAHGQRGLPTDVMPSYPTIVVILLVVPVAAALAGAFLLRKVIITPLGVVRRVRERAPSVLPGVLIIAGVFLPIILRPSNDRLSEMTKGVSPVVAVAFLISLILLAILGVLVGTGWISHTTGRLLVRLGRRPAVLLAGRQLMADPWSGSRTFSALLATVVIGAGVLAYKSQLLTEFLASGRLLQETGEQGEAGAGTTFYTNAIDLISAAVNLGVLIAGMGILVALAEGIVSRRRAYAALVATGVPRRTLAEALAWQTITPLIPATLIALTVGVGLIRSIETSVSGGRRGSCDGTAAQCADPNSPLWHYTEVRLAVPVPVSDLALLGGGTLAIMLLVVGAGWLFLRMSTDLEELRVG